MENNHTFVILAYKESKYIGECIKSVINQTVKSNVVIATSTPNEYIKKIAKKYNLKIIINKGKKGIANDFNFAMNCGNSDLITVAHQDDVYEKDYLENILNKYKKNRNSLILFTNYYEIRNNEKKYSNKNLRIKSILLFPLKFSFLSKFKFIKRHSLKFGNAICCPSVTYCIRNIVDKDLFTSNYTSNMDWMAWEKISKMSGKFIYIDKKLMGHRVHEESTTTKIINDGKRSDEDYEIFCKFWPKIIAKLITKVYSNSEKSNEVK